MGLASLLPRPKEELDCDKRKDSLAISAIIGSTRQGRFFEKPAQWIRQQLHKREGIECRLLDLRDFPMPFFDEPTPPAVPGRPPYET
jgi:NAD(P)H-dependent FMN reductase